jgi:hypothetical protein
MENFSWKVRYLNIFRKSIEKIQSLLKFDNNNEYIIWRPMCIYDISLTSSNGKCFRQTYSENRNTHFMFGNFFSKNRAPCEIMWENMIEPDRPHMTIGYDSSALHAWYVRYSKSKLGQNTTNLWSIINVATCFDS